MTSRSFTRRRPSRSTGAGRWARCRRTSTPLVSSSVYHNFYMLDSISRNLSHIFVLCSWLKLSLSIFGVFLERGKPFVCRDFKNKQIVSRKPHIKGETRNVLLVSEIYLWREQGMIHLCRAHFNLLELSKVCLHIQKVKDSWDGLEVSIFILDFLSSFWSWML